MTPEQVKDLHQDTDRRIKALKKHGEGPGAKKFQITCKEGCASCCYEPLRAERGEALVAMKALEELPPLDQGIVRTRIEGAANALMAYNVHETGEVPIVSYRMLKVACPFLDIPTYSCKIYDSRPYGCRTHLAVGPRRLCDEDMLRQDQQYVTSPGLSLKRSMRKLPGTVQEMDHFIFHLARRLGMEIKSEAAQAVTISTQADVGDAPLSLPRGMGNRE